MCMGKRPKAPRPRPAPPPPPPLPEPPLPPPTIIPRKEQETKLKRKTSKREEMQQASRGTRALRIPLNTGSSGATSLNIPK